MSDDITFCLDDCTNFDCFRHPKNIVDRLIPHSYSYCKETELCPYSAKWILAWNGWYCSECGMHPSCDFDKEKVFALYRCPHCERVMIGEDRE